MTFKSSKPTCGYGATSTNSIISPFFMKVLRYFYFLFSVHEYLVRHSTIFVTLGYLVGAQSKYITELLLLQQLQQIDYWTMLCLRNISKLGRSPVIDYFFLPNFARQGAFFSEFSSGENKLSIPIEKLDFAYSRSSGPGIAPSCNQSKLFL